MSILVNDIAPRVHYVATDGQTAFTVPFPWLSNADLKVYVNQQPMTFTGAPPPNDEMFTATGVGTSSGGTITFGPPGRLVGDEVVIFRDMPIARTTDFPTTGVFPVAALNDAFDGTTVMIQQTEVNVAKRTLRESDSDFVLTLNPIPNKYGRANRVLAFDENGQPTCLFPEEIPDFGGGGAGGDGNDIETQFATMHDAELGNPKTQFIRIFGIEAFGDNGGVDAQYAFTETTPAHQHFITCANGRKYVRVPPPPGVPCNVAEIGILRNKGAAYDVAPFFNKLLVAVDNSDCKYWSFPEGSFYFNTRPNDIVSDGIRLRGGGSNARNAMVKNFVSLGTADAILNFRRSNFEVRDMRFLSLAGSQTPITFIGSGSLVSIVSSVGVSIGYGILDNVEFVGDGSLPNGHACNAVHLYMNGTDSGAGAGGGFGVRAIEVTHAKFFGAEVYTLWMRDTVSCEVTGSGTFRSGGLSGKVVVDGTSALVPSQGNRICFSHVSDGAQATFATGLMMDVGQWDAGVINIAASVEGIFRGDLENGATVTNASVAAIFVDPAMPYIASKGASASGKYRKWSDGRIEQWGSGATSAGVATVTFPIAFGAACDSIVINGIDSAGANNIVVMQAHTVITSGFQVTGRTIVPAGGSAASSSSFRYYATGF